MEFELYNVDGKYICNIIVNTLEELFHISLIYNKRPIAIDIEKMELRLYDKK